jgi:small subunit ribosomal protein S16
MLAIRMQRTGRKGHAQFRVIVQESRLTPTSGRVVANIGSYNPHTKATAIDKEKASFYLTNGAQPSERAARLLQAEGVALPAWVKVAEQKQRATRHPEKLRKNQPAVAEEASTEADTPAEEVAIEAPVEAPEAEVAEAPAEEVVAEAPEAEVAEEAAPAETADETKA